MNDCLSNFSLKKENITRNVKRLEKNTCERSTIRKNGAGKLIFYILKKMSSFKMSLPNQGSVRAASNIKQVLTPGITDEERNRRYDVYSKTYDVVNLYRQHMHTEQHG